MMWFAIYFVIDQVATNLLARPVQIRNKWVKKTLARKLEVNQQGWRIRELPETCSDRFKHGHDLWILLNL